MASTHKRIAADRAEEITRQLRMTNVRPLWFDRFGPKMDTLLSRAQILDELGIETEGMNSLELRGLDSLLGLTLHNIKKFAQKRKYNWVEIYITDPETEERNVYYGFTTSIERIESNIERFRSMKQQWQVVAKITTALGEQQKKQLPSLTA